MLNTAGDAPANSPHAGCLGHRRAGEEAHAADDDDHGLERARGLRALVFARRRFLDVYHVLYMYLSPGLDNSTGNSTVTRQLVKATRQTSTVTRQSYS